MSAFWGWIRQLALLLLLLTVVELLMPRSTYRRYVRLLAGVILILTVLEPLLGLWGQGTPDFGRFAVSGVQVPTRGDVTPALGEKDIASQLEDTLSRQVAVGFAAQAAATIRPRLVQSGLVRAVGVDVELDEARQGLQRGRVTVVPVRGPLSDSQVERLRTEVAALLGLSPDRVVIAEEG